MLVCTSTQTFNKRFTINNDGILSTDAIIQELSAAENLCLKKLSLINVKKGIVYAPAISNLLSNLRSSLETLSIQGRTEDMQTIIGNVIGDNIVLTKLELSRTNGPVWITIINSARLSLLCVLSLKEQHIDINMACAICDLMKQSHLTKLSFVRCSFQGGAIGLITLILEGISFDETEVIAIVDCILTSKLIKLSLCCTKPRGPLHNAYDSRCS